MWSGYTSPARMLERGSGPSTRGSLRSMERSQVRDWVAGYEQAWRSPGTAGLADLFTPDATYQQGPYRPPVVGLPAIERMWEEFRDGPETGFTLASDVVAVDGRTAVVRVEVDYPQPERRQYRELWVIRFGPDGRCSTFEEWPFWPHRPTGPIQAET